MPLTKEQIKRYSRHILLDNVGGRGQEKLLGSRILVIGAGGLGSPISLYLAAAGVGTIGIADMDRVELSNLQRQIAHGTGDIGNLKVDSIRSSVEGINPDVDVITINERIDSGNILDLIEEWDFIIEGTDNFPTKFLVNDACVLRDKSFNQGGILRFRGQTMTHLPGTASYRCVYRQPPPAGAVPTCAEAGVLGAVAGILGTIQATEALKFILGLKGLLTNQILTFDVLSPEFRIIPIKPTDWAAPAKENSRITELVEYEQPVCEFHPDAQYTEVE